MLKSQRNKAHSVVGRMVSPQRNEMSSIVYSILSSQPHVVDVGGPVFNEVGECVGIAFQSLSSSDAENIGYVIPTPVIQHFLTDFRLAISAEVSASKAWCQCQTPESPGLFALQTVHATQHTCTCFYCYAANAQDNNAASMPSFFCRC